MASKITYTDKEYLINDTTIPDKNKVLDTDMNEIKQVVNNNANELDTARGNISNLQEQVNTNTSDISDIKQEQTTQNNRITSLETDNTTNKTNISNLQGRVANSETAISNLQRDKADKSEIPTDLSQLSNTTTKFVNETQLNNAVGTETTARQNADNNLQSQIDAITVSSDVIDVLGTYQDLLNYDTAHVKMNDLIKVLQDSTHENAMTYYRWTGTWVYVGSEGPYYTKSEADELLQGKVSNADFNALENTVIGQGQDIVENTSDITVLKGKVNTIETEQTTQNTNIQTNTNNITALGNRVSTNEIDISNIKTEQTTQNESIEALQVENTELKEDITNLLNNSPEVTGEGSNVILEGTSKNKYKVPPLPLGNSTQVQLTGKNLLEPFFQTLTGRGLTVTYTDKGWAVNGTILTDYNSASFKIFEKELPAGTYTINGLSNSGGNTFQLTLLKNNADSHYVKTTNYSFTLTETTTISITLYCYASYGTFNNLLLPYQLEEGSTATDYEPYCGGIPSPNPTYKQDIHNVSGEIEEVIQTRNMFDETELKKVRNWALNTDGYYTGNIGDLRTYYQGKSYTDEFKEDTQYSFKWTGYLGTATNCRLTVTYTDGTTSDLANILSTSVATKTGTTIAGKTVSRIDFNFGNSGTVFIKDIQLEPGDTITPYVAHEQQNLPFTLAEGQKMYLGDYLADDGIHHVRGEDIFDGSDDENWGVDSNNGVYRFLLRKISSLIKGGTPVLCDKFTYAEMTATNLYTNGLVCNPASGVVSFCKSDITTLSDWKSYAQENPIILEYPLAEEVIDPYTPTQQEQYNAIKKATSRKDTTIIILTSSDADPLTNVVAVADMSNFNPSEIDEIKTAIVALGGVI